MLERSTTALIVVDIQDVLMPKEAAVTAAFKASACKLIHCAQCLELPIVVTEQNPEKLGGTNETVLETLGDGPRLSKMEFGCFANTGFCEALEATGCTQLLVTGMETHICVMQTILQGIELGHEMFVVRDAVASMHKADYKAGLYRMAQAGAQLVSAQMAIFELLRAAGTPEFRRMLPLLK